jgi:methionyl-tRNA synthetase
LTCTPFGNDGNFSIQDFKLKVNADLANNLGNLLNRSLSMVNKYFEGDLPVYDASSSEPLFADLQEQTALRDAVESAYRAYDFQKVASLLLERVDLANRAINDLQPWTLYKEGQTQRLTALLYAVLEAVRIVAILFQPILPNLSQDILNQLGFGTHAFTSFEDIGGLRFSQTEAHRVNPTGPLIPRLDSELVGADKKK